ncbi:Predicted transcriptional regulator [Natronorubrum daqingense]|uniref:Predicted transcriptional regulator n=1 Tax=Natronorubrum daqingense TaxID=588898 RepID=A0A1N6YYF1_9EURY|nr:Predicted transcriptional regulator [Natronorubrum daqingense]
MVAQTIIDRLEKEVDVLNRHLAVFVLVWQAEPIGIVELSTRTDLPHHKVRYSLRVLEEEGLIEPCSAGATTTDHARQFVETLNDELATVIDALDDMKISESVELQSV